MYIYGVNIIAYVIVAIFGAISGQITDILNCLLPRHKKILSIKNLKEYMETATPKYLLMVIHIFIYVGILRKYGTNSINVAKYMILTPMIISAFCIDYKRQIIPNRLTLTVFEVGLIFLFIQGISNLNNVNFVEDTVLGLIVGGTIFLVLTLVGGAIFGKETMGFGDVKMMGALGLYFGHKGIIAVAILAFLIAAVYSIGLLIIQKIRHEDSAQYIAFGPFIVIASFLVIFIPMEVLMVLPFVIFSFGKYKL